jgi:hypothetical protein
MMAANGDVHSADKDETVSAERRSLSPQALRALAEADARRRAQAEIAMPAERNGRDGPEPVRYGDWEVKGIATDF